jgi:hypothetical protein
MNDRRRIIVGLVIFLAMATFPFWSNLGRAAYVRPEVAKPVGQTKCVEDLAFMRSEHMQLLNQWRDSVVRQVNRVYTTSDGRQFTMSLSNTCLDCHAKKADFCDKCHNAMAVSPYCWDCHITEPKGKS